MTDLPKGYQCGQCHKNFRTSEAHDQHCRATHHNSRIHCPRCDKVFPTYQSANDHLRSKTHPPLVKSISRISLKSPQRLARLRKKILSTKTVIIDSTPKCPPHEFGYGDSPLLGLPSERGAESKQDEAIERCIYCGRTRLELEKT